MNADSTPKIDLIVDSRPVGQLGLAHWDPTKADQDTDYSDTEDEDISNGAPQTSEEAHSTPKRAAKMGLLNSPAGKVHKRTRYA